MSSQTKGCVLAFLFFLELTRLFKVFVFVNETTVRKYKSALADEIEPQIQELIDRARKGTMALEKKRNNLKAKVRDIYVLRLPS